MANELAIEFENFAEHYEDPNDPNIRLEESSYEKLTTGNFNFSDSELLLIGQALSDISTKDIFWKFPSNKRQLFNVEFSLGKWIPITDEEVQEIVRNGLGVKMRDFPKVNGIRYQYNDNWQSKFGG